MLRRLTAEQDAILKQDWEEHMELINTGRIHEISAHHGTYLQVRPKAADRTALRDTTNEVGEKVQTLPRGFYLRTRFTAQILAQQLRT
jgi:DNA mismatch repair protein MutH